MGNNNDSIFTKIINGQIPCHKIYEDAESIVFLDIDPLLPGHTLVVPKQQIDHLEDLSPASYRALLQTVKQVSLRLREVLHVERAVINVLGFDVPHAHVHLLPCSAANEYYQSIANRLERSKTGVAAPEPDHDALAKLAKELAF